MNNGINEQNNQNNGGVNTQPPVLEPVNSSGTPTTPVTPTVAPTPTVSPTPMVTPTPTVAPTVNPAAPVVANPAPVGNGTEAVPTDNQAIVNEELKKVEVNYTPPSKFKVFCLILFFILLVAFVLFLPEINEYLHKLQEGDKKLVEEKITTGKLKCSLSSNTANLDKKYEVEFGFTDNKLETTKFTITTRGDITLDEKTLNDLNSTCKQLSESVKSIKGATVTCKYTEGQLVEKQIFELKDLDEKELDAAFVEAGVNTPGYSYGQNIDNIEKNMNVSKYECVREQS